ncbi:hypothetical protein EV356DRAFT_574025 [Viridothelium virens]|uniref:Tat pathway signal sequence n=1 Tax=Viridothelium virens TaxID=1048519 RepID=A0A6A6HIF8_VIRVR|nr:hypothetical protein EV356DRAFT_574025 [Viridothelium virens]
MPLSRLLAGYHRIEQVEKDSNHREGLDQPWGRHSHLHTLLRVVAVVLIASLSFIAGVLSHSINKKAQSLSETVSQVEIGLTHKSFLYNESFAQVPPTPEAIEPLWDSLIPNGLGYVRNPDLTSQLSVISVFHQLHCLYTLRRAYFDKSSDGQLKNFDFGHDRDKHTGHCFEYLRQSLICSADSSLEPAGNAEGFLGWGFQRQCRDYEQLKAWAEEARAFDGHGFLAIDLLGSHQ